MIHLNFSRRVFIASVFASLVFASGDDVLAQLDTGRSGHSATIRRGEKLNAKQPPAAKKPQPEKRQVITPINVDPAIRNSLDALIREQRRQQINGAILRRQFGDTSNGLGQFGRGQIRGYPGVQVTQPTPPAPQPGQEANRVVNAPAPTPQVIKSPFAEFNTPKRDTFTQPAPTKAENSIQRVGNKNEPVKVENDFILIDNNN